MRGRSSSVLAEALPRAGRRLAGALPEPLNNRV